MIDEAAKRDVFGSCIYCQFLGIVPKKKEVTSPSSGLVQLLPEDEWEKLMLTSLKICRTHINIIIQKKPNDKQINKKWNK